MDRAGGALDGRPAVRGDGRAAATNANSARAAGPRGGRGRRGGAVTTAASNGSASRALLGTTRTRIWLIGFALVLMIGGVWPLQTAPVAAQETDGPRVAHSTDGVNLRAEPAYGAEVVATIATGT